MISQDRSHASLNSAWFDVVKQFKYFGNIISHDLDDEYDIKYKLNSFYSSFNSTIRYFNGIDHTMIHLFNAYCIPLYGLSLWNSFNFFNKQYFKGFEIAYNNAIKKILICPRYASCHIAAEICGLLLLKHKLSNIQMKYYHKIINSLNSITFLNNHFLKIGYFCSLHFIILNETTILT